MATKGPVIDWSPDNGLPNTYKLYSSYLFAHNEMNSIAQHILYKS